MQSTTASEILFEFSVHEPARAIVVSGIYFVQRNILPIL